MRGFIDRVALDSYRTKEQLLAAQRLIAAIHQKVTMQLEVLSVPYATRIESDKAELKIIP